MNQGLKAILIKVFKVFLGAVVIILLNQMNAHALIKNSPSSLSTQDTRWNSLIEKLGLSMSEVILNTLIFTPMIVALLANLIVWRLVNRPWLFLVISVFALLGLQSLFAPAVTYVFYEPHGFLSEGVAHETFVRGVIMGALGNVALGIPLLWWLFWGLRRA